MPQVGVEERRRARGPPSRRAPGTPRCIVRGRRGVRERAQHPGDVAQRRALLAALGQRARGLALEVEDHPAAVGERIVWPRWKSPWVRMTRPPAPACASPRSCSRTSCAAADDRRERLGPRAGRGRSPRSPRRSSRAAARAPRRSAPRARTSGRRVGAERDVHPRGHLAELAEVVEERLAAVGLEARRARAPSRRAPSGRNSCSRPSVASTSRPGVLVPAGQPGDGSKPCSVRKRSSSSSGFGPGSMRR